MQILTWSFVAAVLLAATPIMYAALAGALSAQAGVFNIALEGQMLWGAFAAVVASHLSGNPWIGVLAAIVTTAVFSGILAIGAAWLRADPIIIAIGTNLLALGLTSFLLGAWFNAAGTFAPTGLQGLPKLSGLKGVPVLGEILGSQTILVPLSLVLIVAVGLWLLYTPVGLRVRGVGLHPEAASSLGVNVRRYRTIVVLVGGALCGIAGAQLSLGNVTMFGENMSAGRGWIAVAAVILVSSRPLWLPLACLGFGAAEAIGFHLQGAGAPQQLTDAAPYAITLIVIVLSRVGRRRDATDGSGGAPVVGRPRRRRERISA
ncbi:ABC transporter permease [Plantibacter sp. YIM 135347]|uniref:ABC transporter permease n=1 Tax=Plantibacter sp. YIM 135347 TaxID=3423919 RepID=UPI003D33F178